MDYEKAWKELKAEMATNRTNSRQKATERKAHLGEDHFSTVRLQAKATIYSRVLSLMDKAEREEVQ